MSQDMLTSVSLREFLAQGGIISRNGAVPFRPNYAQRCVIRRVADAMELGRPLRLLLLRDRQVGQSTVCLGVMAWLAEATGTPVSVVTHIAAMLDPYRETLKGFLPYAKTIRRSEVGGVLLSTAKHLGVGRGRTLQGAYLSDVDRFGEGSLAEDAVRDTLAAVPTIPGTAVILSVTLREKTPLWFLKMWGDAEGYKWHGSAWDRLYLGCSEEGE